MSWTLLIGVVVVLAIALAAAIARRIELRRMQHSVQKRDRSVRAGTAAAQLQYPIVDLSRCLGCGTCVAVCPESDVLELVHGQAMVVRGAHCQGISACERECPVGAITVTIANLEERDDIPALTEGLESVGAPGLYLAGEVTAHALIKTAVDHGTAVAAEVARRREEAELASEVDVLDLCIVGAGPAGLACALEAKRLGLDALILEQEERPGGTVAKYPRRKLVMTAPLELPLYGKLKRTSYAKEELIDLWDQIVTEQELTINGGESFQSVERDQEGRFVVATEEREYLARNVCLAIGRRGIPTKLGVAGEELSKVAYSLLDANSYQGRRVLVVGGGDSAAEAALGLAEQAGNEVTLSYRRGEFVRVRSKNEARIERSIADKKLQVIFHSNVVAIHPDSVELEVQNGGEAQRLALPNDDVFIMAGGTPPLDLLSRSGVSFDQADRPSSAPVLEQGTGLVRALSIALVLALGTLAFALWHLDYYSLPGNERPAHPKHAYLRPGLGIGLGLGVAGACLILVNLLYILRRSTDFKHRIFNLGSLQVWMTSHVATGILAFLCATVHGAMAPKRTVGGHAFWALAFLLVSGAIGRYFYAYIPRAANGRELELAEVKTRLGRVSEKWDQGQQRFNEYARSKVTELIEAKQWRGSFLGRVFAMLGLRRDLRRTLRAIASQGATQGIPAGQIEETVDLTRKAYGTAIMVAHYEDLRSVLNSWRYLHRWAALLLVLLVVLHVIYALTYGEHIFEGGLQ
jgi:thioredoxin reductase